MQKGQERSNGTKSMVKKEGLSSSNGGAKKVESQGQKKKEASSSSQKSVVKKSVTVSKVTTVKTQEKKKKVYSLPGQKHDAPEERHPLRIFYESLHEQIPESEMAAIWMMEHGLLEAGDAKKALERKQRRLHNEKNGTPIKSAPPRDFSSKSGNKAPLSNGKNKTMPEQKGNKASLVNGKSKVVAEQKGNKAPVANGKSKITAEQKGKRKREYSSDDDEYITKPVKRKLKNLG